MFAVILLAVLLAGIVVFTLYIRRNPYDEVPRREKPGDCDEQCGTCADLCAASKVIKAEMAPAAKRFSNDGLDSYAGVKADEYKDSEVADFSNVLESLKSDEVAQWVESLRRRNIEIPSALRDEVMMLLGGE